MKALIIGMLLLTACGTTSNNIDEHCHEVKLVAKEGLPEGYRYYQCDDYNLMIDPIGNIHVIEH